MAGLRFRLDLFIPEDPAGTMVAGLKIPTALATQIPTIRTAIQKLKSFAKKINKGMDNEEMTIKAGYHKCYHDEDPVRPCDPEVDI